jgi:hypothetical protein
VILFVPNDQFLPVPPRLSTEVQPLGTEVLENGSEINAVADKKFAWTTIFPVAEATMHGLDVPEQAPPLQPTKTEPTFGVAVRLTVLL